MSALLLWMSVVCLINAASGCSAQPTITALKPGKVVISCPSISANSMMFKYLLHLNDSYIIEIQMKKHSAQNLISSQFEVNNEVNNAVYVCKSVVIYPPPFREECHFTEVKVKENVSVVAVNVTASATNQSCPDRFPFIMELVMSTACGVLTVYSLTITYILLWKNLKKNKEDTRTYMNTRPVRPDLKPYKA